VSNKHTRATSTREQQAHESKKHTRATSTREYAGVGLPCHDYMHTDLAYGPSIKRLQMDMDKKPAAEMQVVVTSKPGSKI